MALCYRYGADIIIESEIINLCDDVSDLSESIPYHTRLNSWSDYHCNLDFICSISESLIERNHDSHGIFVYAIWLQR